MEESSWHPPRWMYREKRPPNDEAYFENMTRVIFQAGLSWKMIGKKWPNSGRLLRPFLSRKLPSLTKVIWHVSWLIEA